MVFRWSLPLAFASFFALSSPCVRADEIPVAVLGQWDDGTYQILRLRPAPGERRLADSDWSIPAAMGEPRAWLGRSASDPDAFILHRALPKTGQGRRVDVEAKHWRPGASARHTLVLEALAKVPRDPRLKVLWLRSFRASLPTSPSTFTDYARLTLDDLILAEQPGRGRAPRALARVDVPSLSALMETMSAMASVREILRRRSGKEPATIPVDRLPGPKGEAHPWGELTAALGKPVPYEPLAVATPADFYYFRFATPSHLFRLLDEADTWLTPLAWRLFEQGEDRGLSQRYEIALGLTGRQLVHSWGPQVVTDLAVVGSDPYLREGSDLTLIFRVKSPAAFDKGLRAALASREATHGPLTRTTRTHGGVSLTSALSADGLVRQHRAHLGGFHLISNSRGALSRIIDTIQGKSPALMEQGDFRYFLARDAAVPADMLGFLGDAFISEALGPRKKILEARRMLAGADLLAPGYAALLFGQLFGRAPTSTRELRRVGLLANGNLRHAGGEPILFTPGRPARSSFGQVSSMTPLIDLPSVTKVTASEEEAYRLFTNAYQRNIAIFINPVCLRARFKSKGPDPIRMDLRVLPVLEHSAYRDLQHLVGTTRVRLPRASPGLWMALGVGPQAGIRHLLIGTFLLLPPALRARMDWLGEVAFLGIEDRFAAKGLLDTVNALRVSDTGVGKLFREAPIHAGLTVNDRLAATQALTAFRSLAMEAAPGALSWEKKGKVGRIPYVAITASNDGEWGRFFGGLSVYYGFCRSYLLVSLREGILRERIRECLAGRLAHPVPATRRNGPPQFVVSLGFKKGGPIWQLGGALLAATFNETMSSAISVRNLLETGAPGLDINRWRALSLAYLGFHPIGPDGQDVFAYAINTHWEGPLPPKLQPPAEGSLAARFMRALSRSRGEVSFDDEPPVAGIEGPIHSLHLAVQVAGQE